jgi:hypothetical protein
LPVQIFPDFREAQLKLTKEEEKEIKSIKDEFRERRPLTISKFPGYPMCSALKGTQTRIVVPASRFESIKIVPPTSRTRSCMLMRPKPPLRLAALMSNPLPESLTMS